MSKKTIVIMAVIAIGVLTLAVIIGINNFLRSEDSVPPFLAPGKSRTELTQLPPVEQTPDASSVEKPAVPKALSDAGEYGENIYDAAKADDWKTAGEKLVELKTAVKKMEGDKIGSGELTATLAKLDEAVKGGNKVATLELSNLFTLKAAELTADYASKIPVEITKLDYIGRELEIWSDRRNEAKLRAATHQLRATWDAIKSKVEEHNGTKEALAFESLVRKTETAISIADYARLATPILDEVDNLENVFK